VYLDCDDEFQADYLEIVAANRNKGDVLVFGYDRVEDRSEGTAAIGSWDPRQHRHDLFLHNIVTPLGVAHRRELIAKVGLLNEALWFEADWDYWRRLARAGAEFAFLPFKSGIYHVRPTSQSRTRRLNAAQRLLLEQNRLAGRPIFWQPEAGARQPARKRLLFASEHALVDPANGAAIATRRGLELLASQGFECQAFCSSKTDSPGDTNYERTLEAQGIPFTRRSVAGEDSGQWLLAQLEAMPLTIFRRGALAPGEARDAETRAFLAAYDALLARYRPEVVLTYGGSRLSAGLIDLAKRRDISVVFWLHNADYQHAETFRHVDLAVVPSQYLRDYYWQRLGLDCQVLPNLVDPERIGVRDACPRCVTFINPRPEKGLYVFAAIARELTARRPDIPILVAEGRANADWRTRLPPGDSVLDNLRVLPPTSDPRELYRETKLLLVPSLWNEAFGLVAAEAMANGIPVLASNRGALPETVADAGFSFDIPASYSPTTTALPTAEEVEPWLATIVRLWDDADFYMAASIKARRRAQAWAPDSLAPLYQQLFENASPQPGPPLVPLEIIQR
jgi:glycosyltransferase involved in cell wall biosynthesis